MIRVFDFSNKKGSIISSWARQSSAPVDIRVNPRGREIHHMHDGHTRHTSVPTWYYHFFSLVTGWLWSRSFCVQARSTTDVRANTCHQIDNIFWNALLSVASLPCLGIMECASAVTGSLSGSRQRSLFIPSKELVYASCHARCHCHYKLCDGLRHELQKLIGVSESSTESDKKNSASKSIIERSNSIQNDIDWMKSDVLKAPPALLVDSSSALHVTQRTLSNIASWDISEDSRSNMKF